MALHTSFDPVGDIFGTGLQEKSNTKVSAHTSKRREEKPSTQQEATKEEVVPTPTKIEEKQTVSTEPVEEKTVPSKAIEEETTSIPNIPEQGSSTSAEIEKPIADEQEINDAEQSEIPAAELALKIVGTHLPRIQLLYLRRKAIQLGISRDKLIAQILNEHYASNEQKTDDEIFKIIESYEVKSKTNERMTYRLPKYLCAFLKGKAQEYGVKMSALLSYYVQEFIDHEA